jgi:hypothetical protein
MTIAVHYSQVSADVMAMIGRENDEARYDCFPDDI